MANITEEIKGIIAASLPAQVGAVLQERLNKADELERENEEINIALEGCRKDNRDLSNTLQTTAAELSWFKEREATLRANEKAVKERENQQLVREAQVRAQCAEARIQDMKEFVALAFRSPVYRKTLEESNRFEGEYINGNWVNKGVVAGKTIKEEVTEE